MNLCFDLNYVVHCNSMEILLLFDLICFNTLGYNSCLWLKLNLHINDLVLGS